MSVSWQHRPVCHGAEGKVYLCPQLLPVTAWTLPGCWLLWKLFWDTKLALWSHWVLTANSTWRLSFQESRHIKSRNLLRQTAELCSLCLPLHLIKSTVAEIVLVLLYVQVNKVKPIIWTTFVNILQENNHNTEINGHDISSNKWKCVKSLELLQNTNQETYFITWKKFRPSLSPFFLSWIDSLLQLCFLLQCFLKLPKFFNLHALLLFMDKM